MSILTQHSYGETFEKVKIPRYIWVCRTRAHYQSQPRSFSIKIHQLLFTFRVKVANNPVLRHYKWTTSKFVPFAINKRSSFYRFVYRTSLAKENTYYAILGDFWRIGRDRASFWYARWGWERWRNYNSCWWLFFGWCRQLSINLHNFCNCDRPITN